MYQKPSVSGGHWISGGYSARSRSSHAAENANAWAEDAMAARMARIHVSAGVSGLKSNATASRYVSARTASVLLCIDRR